MVPTTLALVLLARVRPKEHAALWHLYEATNGPEWNNNNGWDNATDPCRKTTKRVPYSAQANAPVPYTGQYYNATPWYGVGCLDPCDDYIDGPGCTAGRISSLVLRENNLVGSTSEWTGLGELRNLTVLDLSYNRLSGVIPTQIGRINNIDYLTLRDNSLSGVLPSELAQLNARPGATGILSEFSLANNRLEGVLPETLSSAFAEHVLLIDVGTNRISGTLPEAYGALGKLQVLYVRNNRMSGTLPASLGTGDGLAELRYMELQGNGALSGTLPESIGALTQLSAVQIEGERLSGTLPTELGQLRDLMSLRLNDNRISGSVPTQVGMLDQLEEIDIHGNPLAGDLPSQIGLLINLKQLYVPDEQLLPLRLRYCQQRLPNVGKYNYRIVREEYYRMVASLCPEPFDTLNAFGTLAAITGDV